MRIPVLKKSTLKSIVSKNKFPLIILLIAIILRFYNLSGFTTFLSDQGRDAIIVKRIVMFEHWPAIGPPTSIGHVFLGPFYYYLIAPFLALSFLNPVGMAWGVAFLSIIGLIICYFIVRTEYDKRTADIFLVLTAFFAIGVEYSRFSWNPNPLLYFGFITLYCSYKMCQSGNKCFAFAAGGLLALSTQLHYLAVFLVVPIALMIVVTLIAKRTVKQYLFPLILMVAGFGVFISPLILFDLKHGFINSKALIAMLTKHDGAGSSSFTGEFMETTEAFMSQVIQYKVTPTVALTALGALSALYLFITKGKKDWFGLLILSSIFFYVISFALIESYRHPHYYIGIYYSFWLILAIILASVSKKHLIGGVGSVVVLIGFIIFNAGTYYFLYKDAPQQIAHAQRLASFVEGKINNKPYNISTWPIDFTEDTYLYFLELKGLRPASREKAEVTDQMFVLCNTEPCSIIDSPSWNINMFGKAKIVDTWEFERVLIYKLVHEN